MTVIKPSVEAFVVKIKVMCFHVGNYTQWVWSNQLFCCEKGGGRYLWPLKLLMVMRPSWTKGMWNMGCSKERIQIKLCENTGQIYIILCLNFCKHQLSCYTSAGQRSFSLEAKSFLYALSPSCFYHTLWYSFLGFLKLFQLSSGEELQEQSWIVWVTAMCQCRELFSLD